MRKKSSPARVLSLKDSNIKKTAFEELSDRIELDRIGELLNTSSGWATRLALETSETTMKSFYQQLLQRRDALRKKIRKISVYDRYMKRGNLQISRGETALIKSALSKERLLTAAAAGFGAPDQFPPGSLLGVAPIAGLSFMPFEDRVDTEGGNTLSKNFEDWSGSGEAFFDLELTDVSELLRQDKNAWVDVVIIFSFDLPATDRNYTYEWSTTLNLESYFGKFAESGRVWTYVTTYTDWEREISPDSVIVSASAIGISLESVTTDGIELLWTQEPWGHDLSVTLSDSKYAVPRGKSPAVWILVNVGLDATDGENFFNGVVGLHDNWPLSYPYLSPLPGIRYAATPVFVGSTGLDPSSGPV